MSASDEFKDKIKAGQLVDALTLAMSESIELKITTWVAAEDSTQAKSQPYIRTRLNLVNGEVENEITPEFLGDNSYSELREFHLEQVEGGRQIIIKNLETLQKIFVVLSRALSQSSAKSSSVLEAEKRSLSPSEED